jgi:hypothetical protein
LFVRQVGMDICFPYSQIWLSQASGQSLVSSPVKAGLTKIHTHGESLLGVSVSEALDVVEDEPGERDAHEHDERHRHEQHRRAVQVLGRAGLLRAQRDVHADHHPAVHQFRQVPTLVVVDEDGNHVVHCRQKVKGKGTIR